MRKIRHFAPIVVIGVPRGGGFRAIQNRARLNPIVKTVKKKLLNLGRQHTKMFGKKGSKILKLPPVRNCSTLAMTNKLVAS